MSTGDSLMGDDLTGRGTNARAANSCGAGITTSLSTEGADDRGDGGDTLIGQLASSTKGIILGLDLLLGMCRLLVGLVLDEEDLRLAGGARLLDDLGVDVGAVGLLAQHIDDSLVLVDGGADLDGGLLVGALWRLDEDHIIVALGHAHCNVTLLILLFNILGRRVNEEALGHNRLLLLLLMLLCMILLIYSGLLLEERLLLGLLKMDLLLLSCLEEAGATATDATQACHS